MFNLSKDLFNHEQSSYNFELEVVGTAKAQWFLLRPSSCGPGFANYVRFIVNFCAIFVIVLRKGRK